MFSRIASFGMTAGAGKPLPAPAAGTTMITLALTAADAAIWASLAVAVIGALSAGIVSVIAAMKASSADAKANAQARQQTATDERLNAHGDQIVKLAQNQTPPAAPLALAAPATPTSDIARADFQRTSTETR